MLPAVFADDAGGAPRRLLAHPAIAWLGLISYGIFLWSYPVTVELVQRSGRDLAFWPLLGATLAISIPVAAASYYGLERPMLKLNTGECELRRGLAAYSGDRRNDERLTPWPPRAARGRFCIPFPLAFALGTI